MRTRIKQGSTKPVKIVYPVSQKNNHGSSFVRNSAFSKEFCEPVEICRVMKLGNLQTKTRKKLHNIGNSENCAKYKFTLVSTDFCRNRYFDIVGLFVTVS